MNTIRCFCSSCKQETNHDVLHSYKEKVLDECYFLEKIYMIVKCCGCDNITYCDAITDEGIVDVDEYGHEYIPTNYHVIPNSQKEIYPIRSLDLPEEIRQIYTETIECINRNNLILAGVGCRATIEAICRYENITGGNLEKQINNLARKQVITLKDRDHLHAIRFMGNDSIHDIKAFDLKEIIIVGEIINTILTSLYIIHKKFLKLREKPISSYDGFIRILDKCLNDHEIGEVGNLRHFIQGVRNIIQEDLKQFEVKLISEIDAGNYKRLTKLPPLEKAKNQQYKFVC